MVEEVQDNWQAKWYALWNKIDNMDKRHAQLNSRWNPKEIKAVLDGVDTLIQTTPKTNHNTLDITRLKDSYYDILRHDYDVDFLKMNIFKDFVHKIWQYGFPSKIIEDHLKQCDETNPPEEPTWREKSFDHVMNIKDFTRIEFRKLLIKPYAKEGYDKTFNSRCSFFDRFVELSKKELGDCFGSFVHDILQQQHHARMVIESIPDITWASSFGIIESNQYYHLMNKISEVARKQLSQGDWTWDVDKKEGDLMTELRLIKNMLDAYKKNKDYKNVGLRCKSLNCRKELPLTDKEKQDLKNGSGISPRYCQEHIEYDESGDRHQNIELSQYDPDCFNVKYPATIRIKRIDKEKDDNIYERMHAYLKENKISVIKECNEKYNYDGNYIYVTINSKDKLIAFVRHFADDMHYNFGGMEVVIDT